MAGGNGKKGTKPTKKNYEARRNMKPGNGSMAKGATKPKKTMAKSTAKKPAVKKSVASKPQAKRMTKTRSA